MKKLLAASMLLSIAFTGCLKDKKYDDHQYGIIITDIKGVAFPQASSSPITIGITGQAAPLTVTGPLITIESGSFPTNDVTLQLAFDSNLVKAKGLKPLPAGSFSLSTMTPTIKANTGLDSTLKVIVNSSNVLDPTLTYGVGITISSADGGYTVAQNSRNIVVAFTIKNKYDGVYRLQGYHNRTPYNFPYDVTIHMITKTANSVAFYWPEVRSVGHPIGTGVGTTSWYGADIAPVVVFNTANDQVSNVFNSSAAVPITVFTGTGSGQGRYIATPAPAKMYVYFNYNNNPLRAFLDTLTYIGPRP